MPCGAYLASRVIYNAVDDAHNAHKTCPQKASRQELKEAEQQAKAVLKWGPNKAFEAIPYLIKQLQAGKVFTFSQKCKEGKEGLALAAAGFNVADLPSI